MDRVGGYLSLLALEQDAQDYGLVLIAMRGEADAARIREMEQRHGQR